MSAHQTLDLPLELAAPLQNFCAIPCLIYRNKLISLGLQFNHKHNNFSNFGLWLRPDCIRCNHFRLWQRLNHTHFHHFALWLSPTPPNLIILSCCWWPTAPNFINLGGDEGPTIIDLVTFSSSQTQNLPLKYLVIPLLHDFRFFINKKNHWP